MYITLGFLDPVSKILAQVYTKLCIPSDTHCLFVEIMRKQNYDLQYAEIRISFTTNYGENFVKLQEEPWKSVIGKVI